MDTGQWLTRGTIWLALSLYVVSEAVRAARSGNGSDRVAVLLNSFGCAAFLAHVACAFHFYHNWSHAAAYADTACQTAAYFGWNWGGGLYFNYAFLLLWLSQVILSWMTPTHNARRAGGLLWFVRSFVLMMLVNGAVVFARGPMRWFGLALCLTLLFCWWPRSKVRSSERK